MNQYLVTVRDVIGKHHALSLTSDIKIDPFLLEIHEFCNKFGCKIISLKSIKDESKRF